MKTLLIVLGIALIVILEVVGSPDASEGSVRRKLDFRDVDSSVASTGSEEIPTPKLHDK